MSFLRVPGPTRSPSSATPMSVSSSSPAPEHRAPLLTCGGAGPGRGRGGHRRASRRRSRSRSRSRSPSRQSGRSSHTEGRRDRHGVRRRDDGGGGGSESSRGRGGKVDYSRLIEGYDKMTPAERVKAKMKLQLSDSSGVLLPFHCASVLLFN